ncbi:MAG: hypothetical protein AB7I27_15290 [Bacteriovoracaceae bacterium]
MKTIFFLLILSSTNTFAQSSWTASYFLKSDICYKDQKPSACDPQYRTTLNEMSLIWTVGSNPLTGSVRVEAEQITSSLYADDLMPIGYHSNFGIAETEELVYVYDDLAWVNKPIFATPGYCKMQIQFQPKGNELTIRILGIQASKCEVESFTETIRELVFQKN